MAQIHLQDSLNYFFSILPIDPKDPKNLLNKIFHMVKKVDDYLFDHDDPLANTWLKYFSNANILAISFHGLIKPKTKITLHTISVSHILLSTFYQYRRTNYHANQTEKTIKYATNAITTSLIIYPFFAYALRRCTPSWCGKWPPILVSISVVPILDYMQSHKKLI